jgi:hypothetical protein
MAASAGVRSSDGIDRRYSRGEVLRNLALTL